MDNNKEHKTRIETFVREHAMAIRLLSSPNAWIKSRHKWVDENVRPAFGYSDGTHSKDIWLTIRRIFQRLKL